MENTKEKIFKDFTNLYQLSKTLRFELKPVGETARLLRENKVFKKDKNIKDKYEATRPFFDKLHREFVKQSLSNVTIEGLDEYFEIYKRFIKDKKDEKTQKELKNQEKFLRTQIKLFFDSEAKKWIQKYPNINFKKKNLDILFEENVFDLLKEKYGDEDDAFLKDVNNNFLLDKNNQRISIFDSWKGFTGYFIKFFETRKNFYKIDGISTAIATRVIDQNLRRFCDNLLLFEKIKNKIDFSEVEQNFDVSLQNIFDIQFYNTCILQDDVDLYHKIIGGESKSDGTKLKGLNEIINKYRQDNRGQKIPFFKKLDKQILSGDETKFIDEIESDQELKILLQNFVKNAERKVQIFDELITTLTKDIDNFELDKIYISKEAFNTISRKWTNQTYEFEKVLYEAMKKDKVAGAKHEKKDDIYKFPDFITLSYIFEGLNNIDNDTEFWKSHYYQSDENIDGILKLGDNVSNQFLQIYKDELNSLHNKTITIKQENKTITKQIGFDNSLQNIKDLLIDFEITVESKILIKDFADDVLHYYQLAKYFSVEKKREWNLTKLDLGEFYTNPDLGYELFYENAYNEIIQVYNKLRNYLTKKPFSEEKWKLNFENSTLASGWDKNKEKDNTAIILRKSGRYYLGIMDKKYNDLFADKYKSDFDGEGYEKMVYKLFPGPNKMMPKVCFSKKGLEFFAPNDNILDIYKNEKFKQGDNFSLEAMHKLIDFYKETLNSYDGWKMYDFSGLKDVAEYKTNIGEFYNDVTKFGYKISWQNVSDDYINKKNENGKLYLFEIHNKDWNLKDGTEKTGTKNLHTLYFESLFSQENASNNFLIKFSGKAELFFRPKTSKDKLGYRKDSQGRKVTKNKRYSEDKIFLHLSVVLNRGKNDGFAFNRRVDKFLANNPEINIIGVDRGEKHLAYYSVINQSGKILDSGSLNKVNNVDYYAKLLNRSKQRENQRKDWQGVTDIKNLKKGYISQVVRKLADLAIEYNAIIVLEDLNMRFKQVRGGIERSIYQQLEKALIEKLNFLVNKKETDSRKAGHLLKAYQLTAPFETFKNMGKQTGIIFYTQASYTSQIDPVTGWRPNLYLKRGNANVNKEQILKFDDIKFNTDKNRFEFVYNLEKFGDKNREYPNKTKWTLCSSVERWRWNRKLNNNKGGYNHYPNLTDNFKELFEKYNIDINNDILRQVKNIDASDRNNTRLFSEFIYLWGLLCQIRNTDGDIDDKIKRLEREKKNEDITEKEKFDADYILSPVEPFFDSRRAKDFGENLPQNGDENGAYNIARKGVIILKEKLSQWIEENEKFKNENKKEKYYPDLFIKHIEWDNFVQK